MGTGDAANEGPSSLEDYKVTCMNFIREISSDYKAWVDYYKLPAQEDAGRRREIDAAVHMTSNWIAKVAQSIKGVDVVMNDGIQKMAEATAGRPFQIGVFVGDTPGYATARSGVIDVRVRAAGRGNRKTALGYHYQRNRFRIESTCGARMDTDVPLEQYDIMDIHLKLHAPGARPLDVVSFTVTVCEMQDGVETERRGVSTILHII